MDAAALRLRHILGRADAVLQKDDLSRLASVHDLLNAKRNPSWRLGDGCPALLVFRAVLRRASRARARILYALLFTAVLSALYGWLWSWPHYRNRQCLWEVPDSVTLLTRPPVDCSICTGVTEVDRVVSISPQEFEEKYAYTAKPVIVQDAMLNWTAPSTFSFDYLKAVYAESLASPDSPQDRCQFFPYTTDFDSLRAVFQMDADRAAMLPGAKPWYVGWSNCDEKVARELRRHYGRPYFLPSLSENKNVDWIFMGSIGYGAKMHVDNVRLPSWQAQLRGSKQWSLQPPPECLYECQSFSVVVEQGEIIVLDTNQWYHSTKIVSEELSITIGAEYD